MITYFTSPPAVSAHPVPTMSRPGPQSRHTSQGRTHELSDVETEGTQLLAAVVGDLVRSPRWHPHPVDLQLGRERLGATGDRGVRLVLDHVGEWAGGRGEGHVERDDGA